MFGSCCSMVPMESDGLMLMCILLHTLSVADSSYYDDAHCSSFPHVYIDAIARGCWLDMLL